MIEAFFLPYFFKLSIINYRLLIKRTIFMKNFDKDVEHPILNSILKTILYSFLVLLVAFFYFYVSGRFQITQDIINWADTIISFILLGVMNLGLWFFVRYNNTDNNRIINLVKNHIIVATIFTFGWILSSWALLIFFVPNQESYFKFLQNTFELKLFIGYIVYFLIIFFYNMTIIMRRNKENIQKQKELESMLQKEELNSLKTQINPHFLFNSLNSISYLVYSNPDNAHDAIVKLSDYFRYTLTLAKSQFTKVRDEIDNIKRYLEIEEIRFPDKMRINYQIATECVDLQIPVLIMQPLTENAVKHGVYNNTELTTIDIIVEDNTAFFTISVTNNYDNTAKKNVGTSTGIENIRKRLYLIYERNDLLSINQTSDIFKATIKIPKTQNNDKQ